jgi:hypothetical protein
MNKTILSRIMLLVVAASVGLLAGCEDKKSDNSTLSLTLLAAVANTPWVVISPANLSLSVSYVADIVIRYKGGTLAPTLGNIQITEDDSGDVLLYNDLNSTITISGDTVTINPDASTLPSSGTWYSNLVISGFEDTDTGAIDTYAMPNYRIHPEPK